jgi:hypothetical protein
LDKEGAVVAAALLILSCPSLSLACCACNSEHLSDDIKGTGSRDRNQIFGDKYGDMVILKGLGHEIEFKYMGKNEQF